MKYYKRIQSMSLSFFLRKPFFQSFEICACIDRLENFKKKKDSANGVYKWIIRLYVSLSIYFVDLLSSNVAK